MSTIIMIISMVINMNILPPTMNMNTVATWHRFAACS
jgi:hypothetical protein